MQWLVSRSRASEFWSHISSSDLVLIDCGFMHFSRCWRPCPKICGEQQCCLWPYGTEPHQNACNPRPFISPLAGLIVWSRWRDDGSTTSPLSLRLSQPGQYHHPDDPVNPIDMFPDAPRQSNTRCRLSLKRVCLTTLTDQEFCVSVKPGAVLWGKDLFIFSP